MESEKRGLLIKQLGYKYQIITYKDWAKLKSDTAKKAFIRNLLPSQLNVGMGVFKSSSKLDPKALPFQPIFKI